MQDAIQKYLLTENVHLVSLKSTSGKLVLGSLPLPGTLLVFRIHFILTLQIGILGPFGAAGLGGQIPISKGKSSVWGAPQARKIRFWNPLNRDF